MSDVPSMAIEKVHMYQNTSIMQVCIEKCTITHTSHVFFVVENNIDIIMNRMRFLLTDSV